MTDDELSNLRAMLVGHEGVRLKLYTDTAGIPTIGIGRNLRDKGITPGEAQFLCENDIADVLGSLVHAYPWFTTLDSPRQLALIDMAFNVGAGGLQKSPRMLAALIRRDFGAAADEAVNGSWKLEVGHRADDIAAILRTGLLR